MPSTTRQRYIYKRIAQLNSLLENSRDVIDDPVDEFIVRNELEFYNSLRDKVEQRWGLPHPNDDKWVTTKVHATTKIAKAKERIQTAVPQFRIDLNDWS